MTIRILSLSLLLAAFFSFITAPNAHASPTPQIVDDFGATGTRVAIVTQNRATVTWGPSVELYLLFDRHVKSNAVQVTLLKEGKALADPWVCGYGSSVKAYQRNQTTGVYPYPLSYFTCSPPKNIARTDSGAFQLALSYKETLAGKEHDLGTLDFKVIEIAHGSPVNTKKTFALNWDSMLGTATVFENVRGDDLKSIAATATRASFHDYGASNEVLMSFWTKYEKESDPGRTTLTCLKGDEVIKESRTATGENYSYWTFNEDQSKTVVNWKQQTFSFMQLYMRRKSPEAQRGGMGAYFLSEHPGDYRCVATAGGNVTAELRFTIDAEGNLVGRDCGDAIKRPDTVQEVAFEEKATTSIAFDAKARNAPYFGRAEKSVACQI